MTIGARYKGVGTTFLVYWRTYGGWKELWISPFMHAALLLTLLCVPVWWHGQWWQYSIAIIPAVLGFSIAAFTLMLGVGDEKFRLRLGASRSAGQPSTLTNTSTSLLHFIVVQIVALCWALVASGRPVIFLLEALQVQLPSGMFGGAVFVLGKSFRAAGFFLLCYAISTAAAATLNIFRVATIFSTYATAIRRAQGGDASPNEDGGGRR